MLRFDVYCKASSYFEAMDYLFACDADMLFVDTIGNEILGERVATCHPGFTGTGRHDDYERNPDSTAYIAPQDGQCYYAGGFYGGTRQEFLKLAQTCIDNIFIDLQDNYIAVWHDESHLNRYFVDNLPTVVLSPSYCYPDVWDLPFPKKILAITKNLKEFQVK
jgi:histo-blood group ABO system transferase